MRIAHWIGTDTGLVRDSNEDAFVWMGPEQSGGRGWLWMVADGMGGAARGDFSSATLIQTAAEVWPSRVGQMNPREALTSVIQEGNRRILSAVAQNPTLRGTGSTLAALSIVDGRAWVAHVGDSRVYMLRQGRLQQLTRDHVASQTRGVASSDGHDAMLSRVVGRPDLQVEFSPPEGIVLQGDEAFVLCTDGLWSALEDRHIAGALERLRARDATECLAELAQMHWSDDNMTVGVVRLASPSPLVVLDKPGFMEWISGTAPTIGQTKTVVMQINTHLVEDGVEPPHSNVNLVPVTAALPPVAAPAGDVGAVAATQMFSPQQIQAMLAAAGSSAAPIFPGSPPPPVGAPSAPYAGAEAAQVGAQVGTTQTFSPQQIQAMIAANSAPGTGQAPPVAGAALPPGVGGVTQTFSPQQIQAMMAGMEPGSGSSGAPGPAPAIPVGGGAGGILAAQGMGSTLPPGQHHPPQRAPMVVSPAIAQSSRPGNASTMSLSRESIEAMRRQAGIATDPPPRIQRQRTQALSEEEMQAIRALQQPDEPPPRRFPWLLVVAGVSIPAVILAIAWSQGWLFREIPAPVVDGSADEAAAPEPAPRPVLPPPPAPEPRAPDGQHDLDSMPYYRISLANPDGSTRVLQVDAHEVLVEQMSNLRRQIPDVNLVYRTSSTPVYELAPCDGVRLADASANSRRPVCAVPETAEVYCNAVGRRMPTADEWQAIIAQAAGVIAPSRGQLWQLPADGAAPEQGREFAAIQGVYDGLPEVLRGSSEQIAQGHLPVLGSASGSAPAVVERQGLLSTLRSRSFAPTEVPMLGFRCVYEEPPPEEVVAELEVAVPPSTTPTAVPGTPTAPPAAENGAGPTAPREPAPANSGTTGREQRPANNPGTATGSTGTPSPREEATEPAVRPTERPPRRDTDQAAPANEAPPATSPTTATGRVQLMDPVYLPPTIEEYERIVQEAQEGSR
jgi:serine/threonine protein phosphatase PrpC